MQRLATGMSNSHGFTLIELMIVLLIISISFCFALVAFGDFGTNRRILFSAEQLVNSLSLAQQRAILQNCTLGLEINSSRYQILQLQHKEQWVPTHAKGLSKITYFPANTVIKLKMDNPVSTKHPAIMITASGEITPFILNFSSTTADDLAQIIGESNGDLNFKVTNRT